MQPELRIFPSGDAAFRGEVEHAMATLGAAAGNSGTIDPRMLVDTLRGHYPNVSVTRQDEFGSLGEPTVIWYVFRDKRVRPDDWRRDRLYDALSRARTVIDDSRRVLKRSQKASSGSPSRWSRS